MGDMYDEFIEANGALSAVRIYKEAYSNKDGVLTVGDITDLMNHIDFIEKCIQKQRRIPTEIIRIRKLFGKDEYIHTCKFCGKIINKGDNYCSKCGQKVYNIDFK